MQLGQTVKSRSYGIVVVSALLATGGFADVAAKPPTRELTEIEKTMSRALEFEMLRNGDQAGKWYKKAADLGSIAARCQFLAGTLNDPSESDTVTEEECDEAFCHPKWRGMRMAYRVTRLCEKRSRGKKASV
jgi:TPR repeat protein